MSADPIPLAERDDEWLVAQCRELGNEAAFAELVRRYREPVFRLAVSLLGQELAPEAEEVAQEVMLRVHHALRTFRGEAKVGSWIYRIAFNQALNLKARARFRKVHVSEQVLVESPSPERGPYDRLAESARRRAVHDCVGELPEVYQSALRLHYWMGASMGEIAALLDVPENTVKSYLHRARRLLQAMLLERGCDAR